MSISPTLTIAIPTYNRSDLLRLLLKSIGMQLDAAERGRVEVIVLDNCSKDSTSDIVRDFSSNRDYVRYIRHPDNIGPDNNFVSAFFSASGTYVWIIGDDELLFDGSIDCVLNLIESMDFGCAYLSSEATVLDALPSYIGRKCLAVARPTFFTSWNFANFVNYRLTFVSGTVVNKAAIMASYDDFNSLVYKFLGSNLVHLSWVCASMLEKKYSVYVDTPLFASTVANSGGYNPVKVFITNLGDIFARFFSGVAKDPRRTVNLLTLLGWFPKVSYDMRFTSKYLTGPKFAISDFPIGMRTGIEWFLYQSIMNSPKPIAFLSVVLMKASYKIFLCYMRLTKGVKHGF